MSQRNPVEVFVYPSFSGRAPLARSLVLSLASFSLFACSSPVGGPVAGDPDDHCAAPDGGLIVQPTSAEACHPDAGEDDAGEDDDGASDFGPTHDGTLAYDDDCKYQVSWKSTDVRAGDDVTFTVIATDLSTNAALTGANMYAEVFLNDTHPGDTARAVTTEKPPGNYTIGPVRFDASGTWTVRFHLFGDCADASEDSPHGHAAFFVDVP
jgi:hypothetical protein